jgi:hypothetical protein
VSWEPNPKPLEETDPVLAALLLEVARGVHKDIKSMNLDSRGTTLIMKNGSIRRVKEIGPNEPCYCKSGKKYKKCCKSLPTKNEKPFMCPHCHKEVKVMKNKADLLTCRCYDPKD